MNVLLRRGTLAWQTGYGVVSFGKRNLPWVVDYIRNQREHQLAYNWVGIVSELQSNQKAYSTFSAEDRLRQTLNERFGLRPWPDVQSRLRELRKEFLHLVRLPEST